MTQDTLNISVNSEIGKLKGVILHTPGPEVENMTPENAERALYSDILNLHVAQQEYSQFSSVLEKLTKPYQLKNLLGDILQNNKVRINLFEKIYKNEGVELNRQTMDKLNNVELATQLLEGILMSKDNLTAFLSKNRYTLKPLHNFFFTRDASIAINDKVLISKMANKVRVRESIIMQAIFDSHPAFSTTTINPYENISFNPNITIEGGDVLVAREDVLIIGIGSRTTPQGIDYILNHFKGQKEKMHIIVQELPREPESFIHLDMVFTFLDKDKCMIYEPIISHPNCYQTILITVDNGIVKIKKQHNLLNALKGLGFDLKPFICGGTSDPWTQQREQWHSGANFFAFAPGKIIGYERNIYTVDELSKGGFEIIRANDIIKGTKHPDDYKTCLVTIEGSELSRGGGGARCMTMPICRENINW
ncbi:MAG: arginine deiminase family protein [Bacteroidales bacterium]|nr:arginine deiminase family protein [Bacteroidales bacterium]